LSSSTVLLKRRSLVRYRPIVRSRIQATEFVCLSINQQLVGNSGLHRCSLPMYEAPWFTLYPTQSCFRYK
jgi:hypothetical protein